MHAFAELFVVNAVPPATATYPLAAPPPSGSPTLSISTSSSQKIQFSRRRRRFTPTAQNMSFIYYNCNRYGSGCLQQQQHSNVSFDPFAVNFVPAVMTRNNWQPYSHNQQQFTTDIQHISTSFHKSFTSQYIPALTATFPTLRHEASIGGNLHLGAKNRNISPFPRSSSSSSISCSYNTGTDLRNSSYCQENFRTVSLPVKANSSSSSLSSSVDGSSSSSEIASSDESGGLKNLEYCTDDNLLSAIYDENRDFVTTNFHPQCQHQTQQNPVLLVPQTQSQIYSDILTAAHSTRYNTALRLCNEQKRYFARYATMHLKFRTYGTSLDTINLPICQSVCRCYMIDTLEAYMHYLESLCPQLAQTHIADVQAHVVAENASGIERSTLDGSSVVTIPTIPSSEIVATSNVRNTNNGFTNSQENISHNSSEAASSVTVNNAADTFDKNKCTLPLAKMHHSKENQTQDVHFLDEDSLLENLPKISQCSSSEQARSQNWMPLRVLSAKRSFETASNDTHFSRQKKQILQMKIPQREIGTAIRGVNERKVGGLSSMSNHQHLSENNWRKNTQISNPLRSFASRPFSTSDGFIHHRERSSSERLYGGTTDLNLDRHHYSSSDGRPTSRTPTSFGSASRSSFGCHDGARSIISGGEGSFEKYFEKRGRGMVVTDCPVYRNARRIGANKSRNFPPVYLALKNRFEFDDNGTLPKSGAIDSSNLEIPSPAACSTPMTKHSGSIALRENGIDQRCVSQQNIRSMSKVITNVEGQMGESLNEQIAVRGKGESGYQSESSSPALHIATEGTCNHVSVHDSAIIESSISTGGSITEEPSIRTADITLDLSSGASTAVQASSELIGKENFELSRLDVLSEEIWYYHRAIAQTESVLNRKLHLRDVLYYAISPVFPMCGLYVVGSSLNGFGTNSSDMDLCLMITNKDLDQRTDAVVVLNMIQSALAETKWVAKMQLILAKVPILRIHFNDPFSDITVDLNANNSVAIRNTHLLCYYSSFDWRVRPLVTIVKEWAKRRDINDANRSSFTSYSLVLMVIHFLQYGLMQPILPSLQQKYPKRFNANADVRSLNVSSLLEPPEGWITDETTTLGELLIGFLEYYAFKFDYLTDAISVRLGGKLARKVVARQTSPYNSNIAQWNCICIEEPFTLSNTAHSVHNQMVFDAIRIAFVDAFYELDANRDLKAFLDVGPIDISFGSSVQMNLLAISVADSPKTSSSKSTILMGNNEEMLTAESKEEDYELIEANGPTLPSTAGFEMESQAIGLILSEQTTAGKNDVESQRNVTVRDEIDAIDIVLDESTTQFASDSQENIVPEGVESGIPPNVLGSDNTSGSIGHTSKSVLSERQPIELQANLSSRPYIDPSGVYETNRQQEDTKGEHLFPDRFLRRRRSGRRTHVSMGCEVRSHSGGSSLTQSMRYHRSGAISS